MIHSLHVAQSGLGASRTSVENVMNNIANENTPGYKKRVVDLGELDHVDSRSVGRGVEIGETYRITNMYMYDNLIKEQSKSSYYEELETMLGDVESVFFETETGGFSKDLDRFFQSIENLRSNPHNEIYKNNLENQAKIVSDDLKNLYQEIEDRKTVTLNSVYDDVENINNILLDIGKINEQIGQKLVQPNDLLDKRDQLEDELSKYINIEVDRTEQYELKIGGLTAVRYNTNIHNMNVIEDSQSQKDVFATETGADTIFPSGSDPFAAGDSVTVRLNNQYEFTVNHGDAVGMNIDADEDGTNEIVATDTIDENNYLRVLAAKINSHEDIPPLITAYNGQYQVDENDEKILNTASDEYLMIESSIPGEKGQFKVDIIKHDDSASQSTIQAKNEQRSLQGTDDVHVEIFDQEVNLLRGSMKAMAENLSTEHDDNKFSKYQDRLDEFAGALADITHDYIRQDDGSYIYGNLASKTYNGTQQSENIGMFSGTDVKSLQFNSDSINNLTQADLDYLSTLQWKDDVHFDGTKQDGSSSTATSFSKFYQTLQVQISSDKESTNFLYETQDAVTMSLKSNYDKMVKVDKDEEMINLIKFQASYEANAKIITAVDEMLQTILGMKR